MSFRCVALMIKQAEAEVEKKCCMIRLMIKLVMVMGVKRRVGLLNYYLLPS